MTDRSTMLLIFLTAWNKIRFCHLLLFETRSHHFTRGIPRKSFGFISCVVLDVQGVVHPPACTLYLKKV